MSRILEFDVIKKYLLSNFHLCEKYYLYIRIEIRYAEAKCLQIIVFH
jgi:hypothetical protein